MKTRYRNVLGVASAVLALGLSVGATAGVGANGRIAEQARDQQQREQQREQPRAQPAPPPRMGAQPQREQQAQRPSQRDQQASRPSGGRELATRPSGRGDSQGDRQVIGRVGPSPVYGNARNDNRGNDRGNWNGGHRPPPRVIHTLPGGYRDYRWNGNRYYYSGGSWYRPYGSSFVSIGVPYGLFVTTLPGPYNSFWYGGSRYFYADDTYYTYEPVRRGYVVTRSPYGDDEEEEYSDTNSGDELFIYPARGQSEKQQADDRYECHRWAANEAHYDPVDDDYDAALREDYQRAQAACLTGRGYTVK